MSAEDRADFAKELRSRLDSRRDVFPIDRFMFEAVDYDDESDSDDPLIPGPRVIDTTNRHNLTDKLKEQKRVSAATLRLLLDYCENLAWEMDFVSYCAGIFHGREAQPGETAFDLLPDVQERISADRLGFGHIYGSGTP